MAIQLTPIGTFQTGIFDEGAAEINAYDPSTQQLFVVNADAATVDILDLSDPTNPTLVNTINAAALGAGANSVAVSNDLVAVAIENEDGTAPGVVAVYTKDGTFITSQNVGVLPDMVTFTPDGTKILVANEGEPTDDADPVGSVTVIDLPQAVVTTLGFETFEEQTTELVSAGLRLFPGKSVTEDLEPEYIAVSSDSSTAYVALQEANALAVVDLLSPTPSITDILPLGVKDHSLDGNGFDASDDDGVINIQPWPVVGVYMPDAIATFEANGETYILTANEGDDRGDADDAEGSPLGDAVRLSDLGDVETFGRAGLSLDSAITDAFPNIADDDQLGRLTISSIDGDTDGDGDIDVIHAYGARSFSIFDSEGNLVFDSGDDFEQITAQLFPNEFNSTNDENDSFDSRSDAKGPEPEAVVVGTVDDTPYAFIGLERIGGVMVYDISDPANSEFVSYINTRDFSVEFDVDEEGDPAPTEEQVLAVGDLGPEGLTFISAEDSPNGVPLLVVSNEVSGSTTVFEIGDADTEEPPMETIFTLELLHTADQEAGIPALDDAPRFSAVLQALKDQDLGNDGEPDNTLLLSSGDAILPGLFFNASAEVLGGAGRADILIQNELGFQAIAFGNHEFDLGPAFLEGLIAGDPDSGYPGTAFPYLSSNLDFSTNVDTVDEDGNPVEGLADLVVTDDQAPQPNSIAATTVIDVNGEKIGVVGATTPTIVTISSPGDVTVNPQPFDGVPTPEQLDALAAEIQADVDDLLAANPDINKVVLLAHMQQISIEQELAQRLRNVDIIVAGGSNTRLVDETDRLRDGDTAQGVYPIVQTDADGNPVAVVNTDGNYKYVGRLVIDFDENGIIIPESYDPTISGAYATDDQGVADLNAEGFIDPEIQSIVDELRAVIEAQESNVFGVSEVYLNGLRGSVRTEETNLGNLTADANLAIARDITGDDTILVSIKNGGGIRDDIGRVIVPAGGTGEPEQLPNEEIPGVKPEGGISQPDIINTLRFNNGLTVMDLTAEGLVAVLEHGIAASSLDDSNTQGRFPQVSGVEFSFDLTAAPGDRIQSAAIKDEDGTILDVLVENGELVGDANRTIRIVTLNFLAGEEGDPTGVGGDEYPFPTFGTNYLQLAQSEDAERTGDATFAPDGSEQDALAEYLFDNFFATPFAAEDTSRELDERLQNLAFRDDTVLGDIMAPTPNAFTVEDGVTSVFLDLDLLSTAAGLELTGADSEAEPFSDDFQVGFDITDNTTFSFTADPFTPVSGTIEHSGTVTFNGAVTVGNFSIGFDANRVSDTASGFFVEDTIEGNGVDVLFDIGAPGVVETSNTELTIADADLLLAPEVVSILGLDAVLAGADVGDARVDAVLMAEGDSNGDGSNGGDSSGQSTSIDFEGPAAGTVITDQFAGATFSTLSEFGVMIFDTANITGGDKDLASDTLGNVLIISEDGDSFDPDDAAEGGTISVEFDDLATITSVGLLDIEEEGGLLTFFGADDSVIDTIDIEALSNNSIQDIAVNLSDVARMDVLLPGSGAIAGIDFIVDPVI